MSAHVRAIVLPRDLQHEFVRVMVHATVEKRTDDYDEALGRYLARGVSRFEAETRAARAVRPYEVVVGDYNAMVDNGIDMALLLLVGGAGTGAVPFCGRRQTSPRISGAASGLRFPVPGGSSSRSLSSQAGSPVS